MSTPAEKLLARIESRYPKSRKMCREMAEHTWDLRLYKPGGAAPELAAIDFHVVLESAFGGEATDIDGNKYINATSSYGVDIFGDCKIGENISEYTKEHGFNLTHFNGDDILENSKMLKKISGLDKVSYHSSGTEANTAAMAMARSYAMDKLKTRVKVVIFTPSYHGWHGEVLGVNSSGLNDANTIRIPRYAADTLEILEKNKDEIACILYESKQGLAFTSAHKKTYEEEVDYIAQVRSKARELDIVFILDDVIAGFRYALGGSQQHFKVDRPDIVSYGKIPGGGLPIGMLCMDNKIAHYSMNGKTVANMGTYQANPLAMRQMRVTLQRLIKANENGEYERLNARVQRLCDEVNETEIAKSTGCKMLNCCSMWIMVGPPTLSNFIALKIWYFNLNGLLTQILGTGFSILSFYHTDEMVNQIRDRIVASLQMMRDDGYL